MHYPHSPHRSDYFTCYRSGDWKVIYHYFPSEASENSYYQLYNLADDPFESTNLAASKPDRLRLMMQGLIDSMESLNAVYPVDEETAKRRGNRPALGEDGEEPREPLRESRQAIQKFHSNVSV